MAAHPFSDSVDAGTNAHTSFLSNSSTPSPGSDRGAPPKYGQYYGFDYATRPNAEMVAWTLFEYR